MLVATATAGSVASTRETLHLPDGVTISRQQVLDTVWVLARAGHDPAALRATALSVFDAREPLWFGILPTEHGELLVTARVIGTLDAVLPRDDWLGLPDRARVLAATDTYLSTAASAPGTPAHRSELTAALRIYRALGAPGRAEATRARDVRVLCGVPDDPGGPLHLTFGATALLVELGEPGCAWTPQVAAAFAAERRMLPERGELDWQHAVLARSMAVVAAGAGADPGARAALAEIRDMARRVLLDQAGARLPDHVDPSIPRILVEALPADERLVLSGRLYDHLVRALSVPLEPQFRRYL